MKNIRSFDDFLNEKNNYPRPEDGNILEYEQWVITRLIRSGYSEKEANKLLKKHKDLVGEIFDLEGDADECVMNILEVEKQGEPTNEKKIYVGIINSKPGEKSIKSWVNDGYFKKYDSEEEAKTAIDKLKEEGKNAQIFSKKDYKKIEKMKEQGQ